MPAEPSRSRGALPDTNAPTTPSLRQVLMVISTLGGGTGTHLVRLLDHLDRDRWRASILCHDRKALSPPAHVPLINGSTSPGILHRFPFAQWRQLRALRRVVRKDRPELVHAYFFWPIIYGRILKSMGTISHLVENREDEGFGWGTMEYALLRQTAGVPDRIICVSDSVRRVVLEREGVDPARTVIIRNGIAVPPGEFSAENDPGAEAASLREELDIAPDELVVGMVANLNRAVKGLDYFVESMPLIVREAPRARFLIVGGGTGHQALTDRMRDLGVVDRVLLPGFRADVDRFYRIMDVSVLTSLSEGLSITILESMSFGLPVVATRVGGNPELVEDGRTGLLVPPKDPEAFTAAVVRLLRDPDLRMALGREGRRRVRSEFSLPQVARRYSKLYEEVLETEAGPRSETC